MWVEKRGRQVASVLHDTTIPWTWTAEHGDPASMDVDATQPFVTRWRETSRGRSNVVEEPAWNRLPGWLIGVRMHWRIVMHGTIWGDYLQCVDPYPHPHPIYNFATPPEIVGWDDTYWHCGGGLQWRRDYPITVDVDPVLAHLTNLRFLADPDDLRVSVVGQRVHGTLQNIPTSDQ
jgi:hypothetical protein